MKYSIQILFLTLSILFYNCSSTGQKQSAKTSYSATEFAEKIKELPTSPILDVRTPAEFAKGHLQNAKNINWNGNDFAAQIASFDKSKPVLIYCLSGARSAAAAQQMRADGFEVYEMEGGIMKWRGSNLPETMDDKPKAASLTKQQFDEMLNSDKSVLVDFYADWCAPCKLMKPYLDEISKDMTDKVTVIRINADDNQALLKELGVDELPVLQVYKKKALTWTNKGFVEKVEVLKHL